MRKRKKMVIALGGNTLGESPIEQKRGTAKVAKIIVDLVEKNYQIVLTHGNGPQVGNILKSFEELEKKGYDKMPLPEAVAMSQGYIGYHLQNSIKNELNNRGIKKNVLTILSQVLVDKEDDAFNKPTKPIGSFFTKEEAEKEMRANGNIFEEDSGRGYRRVVPSPKPISILEVDLINDMLKSNIVIACGGGGIPVYMKGKSFIGLDAVIDKDYASSVLAKDLEADMLLILTAVDKVAINFGKDNETWLSELYTDELDKYIKEKQFGRGSMLPKVIAAKEFVNESNKIALITSLERAKEGLEGKTGTIIKPRIV